MAYTFLHRTVPGHEAPLKPGRFQVYLAWYNCERPPRIGEKATEYAAYARQSGDLTRSEVETLIVQ